MSGAMAYRESCVCGTVPSTVPRVPHPDEYLIRTGSDTRDNQASPTGWICKDAMQYAYRDPLEEKHPQRSHEHQWQFFRLTSYTAPTNTIGSCSDFPLQRGHEPTVCGRCGGGSSATLQTPKWL